MFSVQVSEKTANLNQRKGTTLEEMSDLVGRLNQVIMSRRDKLAPLIRELRPLRVKASVSRQVLKVDFHKQNKENNPFGVHINTYHHCVDF